MDAPAGISTLDRGKLFNSLPEIMFDLLVVGGGIMGGGIALDAASRGLKVLLVEKQDFAAGTSSRSTKLIHGGLRYLKNLEFGLVHTVASERKVLYRNAPHLVIPEPMLLPILKKGSFGYWATKAGLSLYDLLGQVDAPQRHHMLRRTETLEQEPLLKPEHIAGAGLFTEYRTDDSRLTIEVLKTARQFGAICLNYCELLHFTYQQNGKINGASIEDKRSGQQYSVKARCVVNATGPWSAALMQKDNSGKLPALLHTKGVHLVVPFRKFPLKQAVYFDIPGGRMLFAIPRNEVTYLGTTDTPYHAKLEKPVVEKSDVTYLLSAINQLFRHINLKPDDVESSWAGVRVLLAEPGKAPSAVSRKDEIFESESGLISLAGGKLTGYRKLAEQVVEKVLALHFPKVEKASGTKNIRLSGGAFTNQAAVEIFQKNCRKEAVLLGYPENTIPYLVRTYGSHTSTLILEAEKLMTPLTDPATRLLYAEIGYCIHHEGATSLSDFLIRRTGKLYFEREKIAAMIPVVEAAFRYFLNLSTTEMDQQKEEFQEAYLGAVAFKNETESADIPA